MKNHTKKTNLSQDIIDKLNKESSKCISCKLCMDNCPMLNQFCDTPKDLLKEIATDKKVDNIIPYSCALCGYCKKVCPQNIDLGEMLLTIRKHIVKENKSIPKDIKHLAIEMHQKNGFSKIFSAPIRGKKKESDTVFFPGCSLMAYSPHIVMKTYDYLKEKIPGIGIMSKCCGNPTHVMGNTTKFSKYHSDIQYELEKEGITKIIVACQNCYNTIEKNSTNIKVISLWEVIAKEKIPSKLINIGDKIDIRFAIHDPCPTRNYPRVHQAIREIIRQLNLKTKEFEYSKEKTLCCGSGAMLGVTNNKLALKQMKKRANQTNQTHIVTYCEECVESMTKGGKNSIHILDLLFNDDIFNYDSLSQIPQSTIRKWANRYKMKKIIDKI